MGRLILFRRVYQDFLNYMQVGNGGKFTFPDHYPLLHFSVFLEIGSDLSDRILHIINDGSVSLDDSIFNCENWIPVNIPTSVPRMLYRWYQSLIHL